MNRIAFALQTKDRANLTREILPALDADPRLDIYWFDGSDTEEGKKLPFEYKFQNANLKEVHFDIRGGPENATKFGLGRLHRQGYDFCGLIENDVKFAPGWLDNLLHSYGQAQKDGFEVGAITARTWDSRVLFHRPDYVMMWCLGAGMALFTRAAVEHILGNYRRCLSIEVGEFFHKNYGFDLSNIHELWMGRDSRLLGTDWMFAPTLLKNGLVSIGTRTNMATNIDMDVEADYQTKYLNHNQSSQPEHEEKFAIFLEHYHQHRIVCRLG